jgi:hypothetical protein
MMTPIGRLLRQGSSLRLCARQDTSDVNEAYLAVHEVMTHALGRIGHEEGDLHSSLARLLSSRSQLMAKAEVPR